MSRHQRGRPRWRQKLEGVRLQSQTGTLKHIRHHLCDLGRKIWRYRISDLCVLRCSIPQEDIRVGKGLQPCRFADGEASALSGLRVNERVPVLGDMTCDRHAVRTCELDTKAILKDRILDEARIHVRVLRQ